jgi:hypothetical protein
MTQTRLLAALVALVAVLIATLAVDIAARRQSPPAATPASPATHDTFTAEDVLIEFRAHGLRADTPPQRRIMYVYIERAPQAGLSWVEFSTGGDQSGNGLVVACQTPAACEAAWRALGGGFLRTFAQRNILLAFSPSQPATAQRYEAVLAAMR